MLIYKIVNIITGKTYVGQTKRTLQQRLKAHLYEARAKKYNMYLHNAIRKHGQDKFQIHLIEEVGPDAVHERERFWIRELNTLQPQGYNEHEGGAGGCLNPSPELREKLRRAKLGNTPWNKGKRGVQEHSEEARAKMAVAARARWADPVARQKLLEKRKARGASLPSAPLKAWEPTT